MVTLAFHMASPNPLKRTFDETNLQCPLPHQQESSRNDEVVSVNSGATYTWNQAQVPPTLTEDLPINFPVPGVLGLAAEGATIPPPALTKASSKRKKLTAIEQEARQIEKDAKDHQKAEEKARLEESKRAKEIEKEEKRKVREAQTKMRDDEKQKREAERKKKEKSQLRLNSFFAQPSSANRGSDGRLLRKTQSPTSSPRRSIASIDEGNFGQESRSVTTSPKKNQQSDYQRTFPPFFLQSHTCVALQNRFFRDESSLKCARTKIDESLGLANNGQKNSDNSFDASGLLKLAFHQKANLGKNYCSVKEIIERIHGTFRSPIDLTSSESESTVQKPIEMLRQIPVKYLKFAEDVRPPYIGTYTKISSPAVANLRRNPFIRSLLSINYDYDSEAEWEDPGEGEDLDSEVDEEVGDDEEGDEMEGFLDDEEVPEGVRGVNKIRPLIGDLKPISTGLCWETQKPKGPPGDFDSPTSVDLSGLKLDIISDHPQLPIDPYSTVYWQSDDIEQPDILPRSTLNASKTSRMPLNVINRANDLLSKNPTALDNSRVSASGAKMLAPSIPSKTPKRLISSDLMDSFKTAIRGSDLTKAGLVEVLKKQFPKQSKDAIKDTIGLVAERVGAKEADKRWVIKASCVLLTTT